MPHAVETMFSVRETPWHQLGRVVKDAPSAADAIRLAGLDWPVKLQRLHLPDGRPVNRWAVVRGTDGAIVGDAVGPQWVPLQNADAFAWFDPFVTSGAAHFETAGSLGHGRRVWVLAELNRAPVEVVPGDAVRKFLLLSNSHDGTLAVRVGLTPVRVVCANTLAMAHGDAASKLIRIRHTRGLRQTLGQVREIVNAADAAFEATAEQHRALARRPINAAGLTRYVKAALKMEERDADLSSRSRNVLADILDRYGQQAELTP
jgi:phage/plasmid-like protein (TIGR03299 family)